jgi:hypothetical protein
MNLRRALTIPIAIASIALSRPVAAQIITLADPGPRVASRELRAVLSRPYRVIAGTDSLLALPRDSTIPETIIIVGVPRVTVASNIQGSVVVVGGDLWLHPGVAIAGNALVFGGGVYSTMLGTVGGRTIAYREFTYDVAQTAGGYTLTYRPLIVDEFHPIELPGLYGVRLPTYDRVNGLSLAFGPRFQFDGPRYSVEPIVTYRTDLGEIDPELRARMAISRISALELTAGRTTLTNDAWIRGPFINTLTSLFTGRDVRNYRRTDRADIRYRRDLERDDGGVITPFIGGQTERSWSVGPAVGARSGPWSLFGRNDEDEGMLRPNPPVVRGRISSVLAGVDAELQFQDVEFRGSSLVEGALDAPGDARFVQTTLDGRIRFPGLSNHRFQVEMHSLLTFGDIAPPQRFSYLGGSGTLPTMRLLSMGGDQLLFFESRYTIPIEQVSIPFLGSPSVSLRHMIGSAGVDRLPGFVNNVGVRVAWSFLKADFVLDPETRDTDFSVGLSFAR